MAGRTSQPNRVACSQQHSGAPMPMWKKANGDTGSVPSSRSSTANTKPIKSFFSTRVYPFFYQRHVCILHQHSSRNQLHSARRFSIWDWSSSGRACLSSRAWFLRLLELQLRHLGGFILGLIRADMSRLTVAYMYIKANCRQIQSRAKMRTARLNSTFNRCT